MRAAVRAAIVLFALIAEASAGPFQNGSFEAGSADCGGSFITLPQGSTVITGWTVILGDLDYIRGYWQPSNGLHSLDLIGDQSVGGIEQTFDTVPGATYVVSFDLAGTPMAVRSSTRWSSPWRGRRRAMRSTSRVTPPPTWGGRRINSLLSPRPPAKRCASLATPPDGCCSGAALDNVQVIALPDLVVAFVAALSRYRWRA